MTSKRRLLPLLVAALLLIFSVHASSESSSSESSSSFNQSSSSTESSVKSVEIDEAGDARHKAEKTRGRDPPGSPVTLFMPDEFQFYTLNGDGQLVMKQMTKQEIQGMIAAGSASGAGNLPIELGHHQSQLADAEPKVSDVVLNVQKVLKGELNKPIKIHTSGSSIPGSVNSQWTNMLPYILSGGSVDQQDVAQDTSILLPSQDTEQMYVDVVPLQNGKPTDTQFEPGTNYVQVQPTTNEEEIKLVTLKPTTVTNEKPIYLLGNMALDSGILGQHETYTLPPKERPSRPTTTTTRQKLTTLRPTLVNIVKEGTTARPTLVNIVKEGTTARPTLVNIVKEGTTMRPNLVNIIKDISTSLKNQTSLSKPTLYIPVSPSLSADSQNQDNYGQFGSTDAHVLPAYVSKPSTQTTNVTKIPQSGTDMTTIVLPPKKTTTTVFSDEPGFTRVPMIQVPVISADKIITSTQRTNQQQTPTFEILPTISPGSATTTTVKESYPSKINLGPIGGFKKPGLGHKPSTLYRPVYEPVTKSSTISLASTSSRRPVYESVTRPSTVTVSSTYRPVYEPVAKPSTVKIVSSTQRPVYEPVTKTSPIKIAASTNSPVYETGTKSSTISLKPGFSRRPISETSTKSSTSQTPTTGKNSSLVLDTVTKPSITTNVEGLKVTKYPVKTQQTYTTGKASSPVLEIVTKPSIQNGGLKLTKYPLTTPTTEKTSSPVLEILTKPSIQKIKYPSNLYQTYTTNKAPSPTVEIVTKPTTQSVTEVTKYPVTTQEIPVENKEKDSSPTYVIQQVTYSDVNKLPDVTTDSVTNKDSDKIYTYVPVKTNVQSETPSKITISKKPTESTVVETVTPVQPQSVKTNVVTVVPNYEIYSVKPSAVGELSKESESQSTTIESVTSESKDQDKSKETTEESTSEVNTEESTSAKESNEKNQISDTTEKSTDVIESNDKNQLEDRTESSTSASDISEFEESDESENTTKESKGTTSELEPQDETKNTTEESSNSLSVSESKEKDQSKDTTEEPKITSVVYETEEKNKPQSTTEVPKGTPDISEQKEKNESESTTEESKNTSDVTKTEIEDESNVTTEESKNILNDDESKYTTEESVDTSDINESKKNHQLHDTTEESSSTSNISELESQDGSKDTTESSLNASGIKVSKPEDETRETTEESQNASEISESKTESETKETTEESSNVSSTSESVVEDKTKETSEESTQLPIEHELTTQFLPEVTNPEKIDEIKLYPISEPTTEYNKLAEIDISERDKSKPKKPTKPGTTNTPATSVPENDSNSTPIYEKLETITTNVPSTGNEVEVKTTTPKKNTVYNKNQESEPEDEISTVKVIPVYDDDAPMYTLLSDNEGKVPSTTTIPKIIAQKIKPESQVIAETPTKFVSKLPNLSSPSKTTQIVKPSDQQNYVSISQTKYSTPSTSSTPSYTTSSDSTRDTALPGLQEAFNNYMKEHYDPKLSTTGNYDEISQMTTFPTILNKEPSSSKTKLTTLPTTNIDFTTTDISKYQINKKKPELTTIITEPAEVETTTPVIEKIISSKPTTTKPITTVPENKLTTWTTKYSEINKNNTETPIIYLDVKNPDSSSQTISPESNKDNLNNSSFTRIQIKNPINDIDKIISDTPFNTNTPSTVKYTLPTNSQAPNNIASGLIAGYPMYSQGKPITDYVPTTATYETIQPIITKRPIQLKPQTFETTLPQKEKDSSYQGKPTIIVPSNDKKTTFTSTDSIPEEETSTYEYPATETPTYEPFTQIPIESLPVNNKPKIPSQTKENDDQLNSSFIPPLEKISDLINQLQNSPSEHDSVGYDSSNGIVTTIVPLERFETIVSESSTTTKDGLTTIFDKVNKGTTKLKNDTYVVLQTLPSKPITRPSIPSITTKKPVIIETTTPSRPKIESTTIPTTILSIVKKTTTGKPYVTSTYSTTKGFLDKIQSTIDKSAGRINLEEEKNKLQLLKPTDIPKYTTKKIFSTVRRPTGDYLSFSRKVTRPPIKATTITIPEYTTGKPMVNTKETNTEKWTLIPQKGVNEPVEIKNIPASTKEGSQPLVPQIVTLDHSTGAIGLDQSNKGLDKDVAEFLNMCNELSFQFWTLANSDLNPTRSVTLSPFGMISTLAMIFLGARGLTSNQMNDILKLDDVVTFNPHLVFQNITDTVTLARGQGIENAAFVRALFADRLKVRKIIPFYKEQAQQFYEGAVVDINFSTAGEILKRRTNLLIRKQTGGRIKDFVKTYTVPLRSPLTALSANVFQTSCDSADASSEGRDGEMYFAVAQTVKQRKLMPIPAIVWRSGVSAGYEPSLDATAVAIGDPKRPVSLIMVMPGQQGVTAPGDNLERLEQRLFGNPSDNNLEKLLKVIIPRRVELQMPKFSHRSIVNVTSALKKMGFDQLFTRSADLKGINGAGHDLYLADMLQMNLFSTCGNENKLGERHLSETYPGTSSRHMRAWEIINNINNGVYDRLENNKSEDNKSETSESSKYDGENDSGSWSGSESSSQSNEDVEALNQQLSLSNRWTYDRINNLRESLHKKRLRWFLPTWRPRSRVRRQVETEKPRMKMDKPFLYLIRHNLTGLILHIGRFNPKNQS